MLLAYVAADGLIRLRYPTELISKIL